jgi:uncharacterized membrane protein YphA (DoxX/SURF4 family)
LNKHLKEIYNSSWTELIIRWFLGIIFVYASFHKIAEPDAFAKIIYGYDLFPKFSINLIAIIIPFLELISGAALLAGVCPRSAVLIINGMLFGFIIALSVNLIRGHEFDCGCFSFGETSSASQLLVRDILYFILGLYVFFYHKPQKWCIFRELRHGTSSS